MGMREEFERVVGTPWDEPSLYKSAWVESWNASRSTLVIEMPDRLSLEYMTHGERFDGDKYVADMVKALHAAGVRTK